VKSGIVNDLRLCSSTTKASEATILTQHQNSAMAILESAIPEHLLRDRTLPVKTPPKYEPPFPAYTARFVTDIKDFVMAVFGAQYRNGQSNLAGSGLKKLRGFVDQGDQSARPEYCQPASVTENTGTYNEVLIAYWRGKAAYNKWAASSGFDQWWKCLDPESEQHGWFLELYLPSPNRLETVFSDDEVPEGVAHLRDGISGQIREHVYWGSMRDRMPESQTDELKGTKGYTKMQVPGDSTKQRLRVPGRENLAVIRSGQDWSGTTPHENELYLNTMHPVLIKGMDFLRDEGEEVGCFSCRFMDVLDPQTYQTGTDKTFGLAYFDDLSSLEMWSKEHKTHLDIFGRFLQYAKELQNQVSLRLFHEVMVLRPDQQVFEYIGCHGKTGMLASLSPVVDSPRSS
jgi:hypothetical protein